MPGAPVHFTRANQRHPVKPEIQLSSALHLLLELRVVKVSCMWILLSALERFQVSLVLSRVVREVARWHFFDAERVMPRAIETHWHRTHHTRANFVESNPALFYHSLEKCLGIADVSGGSAHGSARP
eukprot:CAMPEP_0185847470 /NCGR_PEP_ID=MMETSP1354-20130828/2740_1 /TAXON_ID=708628 /ORGANISM="Erythrolobus madagascarensis, Strain CCMP3276" /LENGTH=126 /DNA_ID=CAMNT_0028547771 /DNA_START=100 /DNA_END=480 /DNA_ORIENTATION=-